MKLKIKLILRIVCLLFCLSMVSCYDYNFKEVKVNGQVYLVLHEGTPDHYVLMYKESDTHYRPLVDEKILILKDAGDTLYVGTYEIPNPHCYRIDPKKPDGVKEIKEEEFVKRITSCRSCKTVTIPQP